MDHPPAESEHLAEQSIEAEDLDGNEQAARVRVKNRRAMFLDRNPSYFKSPGLELADPLLYDKCVRQFQSASEREAEGRSKGYSGILEADLYRSEAKLAALTSQANELGTFQDSNTSGYSIGSRPRVFAIETDETPLTKDEGMQKWVSLMAKRFIDGKDDDFAYEEVDNNEEWDVFEIREAEERWFEEEEPEWIGGFSNSNETGIQDF